MYTATVTIGEKQWNVNVASTFPEISQGLSGQESLPINTGMLFDLGSEYNNITINMQEMLFPLDIIFINNDLSIVAVVQNVLPGEDVAFVADDSGARYFFEINAEEADGIVFGDTLVIAGYTPQQTFNWLLLIPIFIELFIVIDAVILMSKITRNVLPSTEGEATFPVEAKRDLTFCRHMSDLEKTAERTLSKEEIAEKWEKWKVLRYRPKTEEERAIIHSIKYGDEELPDRERGL